MNEEELTMLAREDGREEIGVQELMRSAEEDGAEPAHSDSGTDGGEPGDREPGDREPGDGEPGDGEPGDGEPDGGETREDAARAVIDGYRSALSRLLDDGWTMEELSAMCADESVRRALERGETLGRAATAYMRSGAQARRPAKRGVPTFRAPATEDTREDDPIARMTDAEFAAFSRRAKEAALAGKRIRLG